MKINQFSLIYEDGRVKLIGPGYECTHEKECDQPVTPMLTSPEFDQFFGAIIGRCIWLSCPHALSLDIRVWRDPYYHSVIKI